MIWIAIEGNRWSIERLNEVDRGCWVEEFVIS